MRKEGEWSVRKGKMIAPIVVAVLLIVWFAFWAVLYFSARELSFGAKLTGTLIPLAAIGVTVFVTRQRIREIRSGEEDDLGKY